MAQLICKNCRHQALLFADGSVECQVFDCSCRARLELCDPTDASWAEMRESIEGAKFNGNAR